MMVLLANSASMSFNEKRWRSAAPHHMCYTDVHTLCFLTRRQCVFQRSYCRGLADICSTAALRATTAPSPHIPLVATVQAVGLALATKLPFVYCECEWVA